MKHLGIHSRLEELSLHPAAIDISCPGQVAYEFLEKNADTPGIALIQGAKLIGMISRRRFLEALSRAYGRELFLRRPLSVLYSFIQLKILRLSSSTLITEAAQQAIARAPELIYEPVVVVCQTESCCPVQSSYCLLGMHELLQAQSTIHQLTAVLLQEKTRSEIMQTEKMASLGKMMAGTG